MSIGSAIVSSLARAIGSAIAGGGAAFSPDSAFFAGRAGFAFDFTDTSKLYQLSNGTTAVTADSDPIGYVTDLSGNGKHGTQATGANRPLYKTGTPRANFNGTSHYLTAGTNDFSGTDKVTVIVSCTMSSSGNRGLVGHGATTAGDFNLLYSSGSASWRASLYGSSGNAQVIIAAADKPANPHTKVFAVEFDLAGATATDEIDWRMQGVSVAESVVAAGPAGGGNFRSATTEVGRCTSGGAFYMIGDIYRIIVIGGTLTTAELFNAEYWCGQAIGYTVIPEIPPAGDAYYNLLNSYGQSLSLGVSSLPLLSTTRRYSQDFMFSGLTEAYSPAPDYASLIPLAEGTKSVSSSDCGESPLSGMAEMLHEQGYANGFICTASGFPSLTIAQLSKGGGTAFTNFMATVTNGRKRAREESKQFKLRAFTWMQGENDGANNTYAANMNTLLGDLNTDAKAITLQTEDVWMLSYQLARAKIGLAQLDASNTYDRIRVAMPTYFLPTADGVHLTNTSSKVAGAYFGLAYDAIIVDGDTDWQPLKCTGSSVAGTTIDLTYNRSGLEFDTTIVAAQTNQGFAVLDAGLTPLTVSSVTIVGDSTVRIVVASGTPAHVYYGFDDPTDHTANIAKGNLRDSQGDAIVFDGDGLDYPMHNWAVLQSIAL